MHCGSLESGHSFSIDYHGNLIDQTLSSDGLMVQDSGQAKYLLIAAALMYNFVGHNESRKQAFWELSEAAHQNKRQQADRELLCIT